MFQISSLQNFSGLALFWNETKSALISNKRLCLKRNRCWIRVVWRLLLKTLRDQVVVDQRWFSRDKALIFSDDNEDIELLWLIQKMINDMNCS